MKIELKINCEWWVLRAGFIGLCSQYPPYPGRPGDQWIENGWEGFMFHTVDGEEQHLGVITMIGENIETTIVVEDPWDLYEDYWRKALLALEKFNLNIEDGRRHLFHNTPQKAIEYYYRARSQGQKKTLGEIASLTGFSESYLRKIKVEYDKAGKWGSKRKTR